MKTHKGISLLVIILSFSPLAMAQAKPAAVSDAVVGSGTPSPAAPAKQEIVEVKIQVDFAWKEDMLPLAEEDLKSFVMALQRNAPCYPTMVSGQWASIGHGGAPRPAVAETRVWYKRLQPSTMPAGLGSGWQSARITMVFHQRLGSGLQGSLETREVRGRMQRLVQSHLLSWLRGLDKSAGLSKRLKADVLARRDRYRERLDQLKPDEYMRQLDRQIRELEVEEFAKRARYEAMEKKIYEIRERAEIKSAADPILKELKEIAAIREEAQKLAKREWSRATTDGKHEAPEVEARLRGAQVKALEARVQVAQRREAIAVSAGGDLLTKLTNEAAMLSIDLAEMQARKDITGLKRKESEDVKALLEESIEKAQQELKDAEPWRIISTPEPQVRPMGEKPLRPMGEKLRKAQG